METAPLHLDPKLPRPLTSLLGRECELAEIASALRQDSPRLLTVTGPAGVGKTRLAIEAAWELADSVDTVAFVSLAALNDGSLVIPTIAQALGVAEEVGTSPDEALARHLKTASVLLVLDNLEHLPSATPEIAALLATNPRLKALATSRSLLQIRGEQAFPLACLPLPQPSPTDDSQRKSNPAIALFVERAHEVDPGLAFTAENAEAIAAICRQLDGLPLAIELAAARVKLFSPTALLARLDHRLSLLTDGPRDLPDRQRTLRAALAWSYDLLSESEKRLFCLLSIFAGGFGLHAAEIVLESEDISVVDGFSSLVNNNLLQRSATGPDEARFVMLETIREFGLETLEARGEIEVARDLHANYCVALSQTALPQLSGGGRTSWLARLDVEHDNVRAALAWLIQRQEADRALRLAGALWRFWWWRSHLSEGRRWLDAALALPGADAPTAARALTLTGAGAVDETLGDYASAETRYAEALACWEGLGDSQGRATTLLFRWLLAFNAEQHDQMTALATESLALFERLGDEWGRAMSLMELGVGAMRRNETASATSFLKQGLTAFQKEGDTWGAGLCLGILGNVHSDRGEYADAARLIRESLAALLLIDDRWGLATILPAAARLAMDQRDVERAVRISAAAAALHEALGAPLKPPFRGLFERNLERARESLGDATYARLWAEGRSMSPQEIVASAFVEGAGPSQPVPSSPLTARELEVLRLVAKLRTDHQISEDLFISYRTVTSHLEHINDKLGVNSRHEAVEAARNLNFI